MKTEKTDKKDNKDKKERREKKSVLGKRSKKERPPVSDEDYESEHSDGWRRKNIEAIDNDDKEIKALER